MRKTRRPNLEVVMFPMLRLLEKKSKQEVNHKRQLKELTPFLIPDHQIRNQIVKEFITDRGLVPDRDQALENEHQDVMVIDIILHHPHPDTHSIAEEGGICVQGLHPNPQFEVKDSEVEAGVKVVTGEVYTTVTAVEVRRHQLVRARVQNQDPGLELHHTVATEGRALGLHLQRRKESLPNLLRRERRSPCLL